MTSASLPSSWFQRYLLPGLAFKAVVIGGGYATGRELAEFFLPSGPWGGALGMAVAAMIWSVVAALTFAVARQANDRNYRSFFHGLLGPAWFLFEIAFLLLLTIMLAVFGAAAGSIGAALFGWPMIVGTLLLVAVIAAVSAFGNVAVEALFKYVSILLYAVYALFLIVSLTRFGPQIATTFGNASLGQGWLIGGVTYAGYNIVGAVLILPVVRHLQSGRDAVVAGVLAGPLAMLPAFLFFLCLAAWPAAQQAPLPSDYLLEKLDLPLLRLAFQVMIFAALCESGTGALHALNERIAASWHTRGKTLGWRARFPFSLAVMGIAVFLATKFGLIALIARGYRLLSYAFIAVYVVPLLTRGTWMLIRRQRSDAITDRRISALPAGAIE